MSAAVEVERADAIAQASSDARAAIEQEHRDRLVERLAAAEKNHAEQLSERLAAAGKDNADRLQERLAAAEKEHAATLDERLAAVEKEHASRLTEHLEAADRDNAARLKERLAAAEQESAARLSERLAATEREAAERLSARVALSQREHADQIAANVAANERVLSGFQSMDRGQSLSEILHALVAGASAEARRVAIFLVKGPQLQGWRFSGFGDALPENADLQIPLAEAGLLADAARTRAAARSGQPPSFAGLPADRPALGIPLIMNGQVFAMLYADQGTSGEAERQSWPATIEILARHAARALEAITALRLAQVAAERSQTRAAGVRN